MRRASPRRAVELISCDVAVERPQKFQQNGNPYRVRIRLRVPPGQEVVIDLSSSRRTGRRFVSLPLGC